MLDRTLLCHLLEPPGNDSDSTTSRNITEALRQLGWRRSDQQPLETFDLYSLERSLLDVLTNVSDKPVSFKDRDRLSPVAIALARAALCVPPAREAGKTTTTPV